MAEDHAERLLRSVTASQAPQPRRLFSMVTNVHTDFSGKGGVECALHMLAKDYGKLSGCGTDYGRSLPFRFYKGSDILGASQRLMCSPNGPEHVFLLLLACVSHQSIVRSSQA